MGKVVGEERSGIVIVCLNRVGTRSREKRTVLWPRVCGGDGLGSGFRDGFAG